MAFPLNLNVTALIFAAFVTFSRKLPRSMAVPRPLDSVCSNPCKNRTGSVNEMNTLTPFPLAMGFSSDSIFDVVRRCEVDSDMECRGGPSDSGRSGLATRMAEVEAGLSVEVRDILEEAAVVAPGMGPAREWRKFAGDRLAAR